MIKKNHIKISSEIIIPVEAKYDWGGHCVVHAQDCIHPKS
jgi:hypothetical protein